MLLSVSNIGWEESQDAKIYDLMKKNDYSGLEIAPTRIFPETPYDRLEEAAEWSRGLKTEQGFCVPSMQSIWFGRSENLFGTSAEREQLLKYTKKAIDFAAAVGCKNLVFGCPRNRSLPDGVNPDAAAEFFKELGDYAYKKGTVIGMEANPPIYSTNYINDTKSAVALIKQVNSKGFLLNLDIGTMIQNEEDVEELAGQVHLINHVHVSEPRLAPIQERKLHEQIAEILKKENYAKYVSIEMGKVENISIMENAMAYVRKVFL